MVKIGAAFADGRVAELIERLTHLVAGRLLRMQFATPKRYEPAGGFDDLQRTKLTGLVASEILVRKLLEDTPFLLEIEPGKPWRISLPVGNIAVELHDVERSRWFPVLRKMRDFFDFTKGRRWREAIEAAEVRLTQALTDTVANDIDALHHYVRGSDRVIVWGERVREVLESPIEMEKPKAKEFDGTVETLRREISVFPNPMAAGARVLLLGMLGAGGSHFLAGYLIGSLGGIVASILTLVAAAAAGAWFLHQAHARLMRARAEALAALAASYEARMRDNVLVALGRIRESLLKRIDSELADNLKLEQWAIRVAEELEKQSEPATVQEMTNVEEVVPVFMESAYLEHLSLPWNRLLEEAVTKGSLVPHKEWETPSPTSVTVTAFSRRYLESRIADLSLWKQLNFRATEGAGYAATIIEVLERRSRVFAPGVMARGVWLAPSDVLAHLHNEMMTCDPEAVQQPMEIELLGCLRTETLIS